MKTCGKCGKGGHNARTCKTGKGPAKAAQKTAAPATTVRESLVAKQKQLQHELGVIDRVLEDLNAIGVS
jgi:hypothetical protein